MLSVHCLPLGVLLQISVCLVQILNVIHVVNLLYLNIKILEGLLNVLP